MGIFKNEHGNSQQIRGPTRNTATSLTTNKGAIVVLKNLLKSREIKGIRQCNSRGKFTPKPAIACKLLTVSSLDPIGPDQSPR